MAGTAMLECEAFYHVYTRGNNGEDIFREERNYAYFLGIYQRHVSPIAETWAYCLMRNHLHLLVHVREPAPGAISASQAFSNLFNAYARAYNRTYDRTGALFQRPFGRERIADDDQLCQAAIYIHANPIKHGFAGAMDAWPHSSYDDLLGASGTWLQRAKMWELFGGCAAFERAHRESVEMYRRQAPQNR